MYHFPVHYNGNYWLISYVMDINEKLTVSRVHVCIAIMENDVHHARLIKNPIGSKER